MADLLDQEFIGATHDDDPKTILRINELKLEFNDSIKKVKQGRFVIFALVLLTLVSAILGWFSNPYDATKGEILIEGFIFLGLYAAFGFFLPKNPTLYLALGLSVYILYQVLVAFVDPSTIFSGLLIKIIVLVGLIRGLLGAREVLEYGGQLNKLGVTRQSITAAQQSLKPIPRTPQTHKWKQAGSTGGA